MALVHAEDRDGTRHLVLNRPEKRNALNGELIVALGAAVEEAAGDDSVRVVVLRGDGPMGCPAPAFIAWSITSIEPTPSS